MNSPTISPTAPTTKTQQTARQDRMDNATELAPLSMMTALIIGAIGPGSAFKNFWAATPQQENRIEAMYSFTNLPRQSSVFNSIQDTKELCLG